MRTADSRVLVIRMHVHQQCKKGCYICDDTVKIGPAIDLLSCVNVASKHFEGSGQVVARKLRTKFSDKVLHACTG